MVLKLDFQVPSQLHKVNIKLLEVIGTAVVWYLAVPVMTLTLQKLIGTALVLNFAVPRLIPQSWCRFAQRSS